MNLRQLVGVGDKVGLAVAPAIIIGVLANVAVPSAFTVGGPPEPLRLASYVVLAFGLLAWAWSVVLILTRVPRRKLITGGPFALVRHPLYTSVALLILPSAGFLLDTWLGLLVGVLVYVGSRVFAPAEEAALATTFGSAWQRYREAVLLPWI